MPAKRVLKTLKQRALSLNTFHCWITRLHVILLLLSTVIEAEMRHFIGPALLEFVKALLLLPGKELFIPKTEIMKDQWTVGTEQNII